jgi:Tfp pilus assembly protein PilV
MLGREHQRRTARGFTLMEAVAAIVVLSVCVPAMMWSLRMASGHSLSELQASRARWLVQEKLEDIMADRHSSTRGFSYLTAGNYPAESSIAGSPGFSRSVAFSQTAADLVTAGTGYMKVTVNVTYGDWGGTSRTLSVCTVITDYTP